MNLPAQKSVLNHAMPVKSSNASNDMIRTWCIARNGDGSIVDAFGIIDEEEAYGMEMNIEPYKYANIFYMKTILNFNNTFQTYKLITRIFTFKKFKTK